VERDRLSWAEDWDWQTAAQVLGERIMQNRDREPSKQLDFGTFYPLGYIVAAFSKTEDALRVQKDLLTGGYDPDDCIIHKSEDVATAAAENLKENNTVARYAGKEGRGSAGAFKCRQARRGVHADLCTCRHGSRAGDEHHSPSAVLVSTSLPPLRDRRHEVNPGVHNVATQFQMQKISMPWK